MLKMKTLSSTLFVLLAVASAAMASAQTGTQTGAQTTPQLKAVLAQMDAASAKFKSAEASYQKDLYEKIVHDTTTDKGIIFFERSGNATVIGTVLSGPDGKPKQIVSFADNILQSYTPGNNQMQVFNAGTGGSAYQGFLTLGFGGSGADLVKSWTVADAGPETLTIDGQKFPCEKLNLVPKDPGMAKNFKRVEMWVDTAEPLRGIGVREIFYTSNGDYQTATYSNIRLNVKIDKNKYGIGANNKVKTAKGTQVFNH
jgi:outer membrane lipoprotein-sorting protein